MIRVMLHLGQGILEVFVAAQALLHWMPSEFRKQRSYKKFQIVLAVWTLWRNPCTRPWITFEGDLKTSGNRVSITYSDKTRGISRKSLGSRFVCLSYLDSLLRLKQSMSFSLGLITGRSGFLPASPSLYSRRVNHPEMKKTPCSSCTITVSPVLWTRSSIYIQGNVPSVDEQRHPAYHRQVFDSLGCSRVPSSTMNLTLVMCTRPPESSPIPRQVHMDGARKGQRFSIYSKACAFQYLSNCCRSKFHGEDSGKFRASSFPTPTKLQISIFYGYLQGSIQKRFKYILHIRTNIISFQMFSPTILPGLSKILYFQGEDFHWIS